MAEQSLLEAIREGLHEEMARDPAVYMLGEDVALGGPFGVTAGLAEAFGTQRVVNTPISEGAVMGLAIGAAAVGLRPVIEIMFIDFINDDIDFLTNLGGQTLFGDFACDLHEAVPALFLHFLGHMTFEVT